ncbi:hypothetical protein ACGH2B_24890 [Streptomyces sp. BBFR2]|uniref:hypothetical protein n=1 Tax=Streptomyces sp. BBFR2 TaxID=3372854 RepID=UPI0037D9A81C
MAGRIRDLGEAADIACRHLAHADTDASPEPIPDGPGAVRSVIEAVCRRIGAPVVYGGAVRGPYVRWTMEDRTLLLTRNTATTLHLAVREPHDLAQAERQHFEPDLHDIDFARLPYMWRLHLHPSWPPPPRLAAAPDWLTLEASLAALLRSCAVYAPQVLPSRGHFGFNITTNGAGNGSRTVGVAQSGPGLTVLVDDWAGPEPTPHDEMLRRGWDHPLAGWWGHDVLDPDETAHAAELLINELRLDARTPTDLRLTDTSADPGRLVMPGLTLAPA